MLCRSSLPSKDLQLLARTSSYRPGLYSRITNRTVTARRQPRSYRFLQPLQSTSSNTVLLIVVATSSVLGSAFLLLKSKQAPDNTSPPPLSQPHSSMPTEILPGRSGNLTPEQDLKLQEFWIILLRTCGVLIPDESHPTGHEALKESFEQRTRAGTADSHDLEKKKRSRLGSMFGRKKGGADGESEAVTAPASPSEDKHGQEKDFQHVLANVPPADLRRALWSMAKHDDPDELLLRFLRARKWNVHNALVMLVSTMYWRIEMHVDDDIMRNGEHGAIADQKSGDPKRQKRGNDFMFQLEKGKSFVHGTDRDGRPMCFVRVKLHKAADQDAANLERYTVFVIETARLALTAPVDTAAIVFDMTDFSMANMVRIHLHPSHHPILISPPPLSAKANDPYQGLCPSEIHDKSLRSQLPRIPRRHPGPPRPLGLQRNLAHNKRLARPCRRFKSPLYIFCR